MTLTQLSEVQRRLLGASGSPLTLELSDACRLVRALTSSLPLGALAAAMNRQGTAGPKSRRRNFLGGTAKHGLRLARVAPPELAWRICEEAGSRWPSAAPLRPEKDPVPAAEPDHAVVDLLRLRLDPRLGVGHGGEDDYYRAALLIVFAMFFDMLDGRVARMTKTQSAFGLQIDSLADVVSFGVAPVDARLPVDAAPARASLGPHRRVRLHRRAAPSASRASTSSPWARRASRRKPSKYIVGLPDPGRGGHPRLDRRREPRRRRARSAAPSTSGRCSASRSASPFLMVSTIRFRSFKDLKLNAPHGALRRFAVGSSAIISTQLKPAFVLVWLLGFYVLHRHLRDALAAPRPPARARRPARAEIRAAERPPEPPPDAPAARLITSRHHEKPRLLPPGRARRVDQPTTAST